MYIFQLLQQRNYSGIAIKGNSLHKNVLTLVKMKIGLQFICRF